MTASQRHRAVASGSRSASLRVCVSPAGACASACCWNSIAGDSCRISDCVP